MIFNNWDIMQSSRKEKMIMKKLLIFVIFIMFVFSPLSVVAVGDYGKNPDHPTPTPPTVTVAPIILDEDSK